MQCIAHNSNAIGKVSAYQLYNCKSRIQPKGKTYIGFAMMMVAVAMPMRMIMVVVVRHSGCKGE
jgi:hypothetical protein